MPSNSFVVTRPEYLRTTQGDSIMPIINSCSINVGQPWAVKAPFTRYNLLSNWLSNRFDNWVNVCIHDTTGCQTRYQTGPFVSCIQTFNWVSNSNPFDKWLYRVYSSLLYRLYNPVWQPVERSTRLSNRVCQTGCTARFDNRLNKQWLFVQHVTAGCIA